MNTLTPFFGSLAAGGQAEGEAETQALLAQGEALAQHGLQLSPQQAQALCAARRSALQTHRRFEFGPGALPALMAAFCDSPFVDQRTWADTLAELLDLFYQLKNETGDAVPDDELVAEMARAFNGSCQGSLDLLRQREMEGLIRRATGQQAEEPHTFSFEEGFIGNDEAEYDDQYDGREADRDE